MPVEPSISILTIGPGFAGHFHVLTKDTKSKNGSTSKAVPVNVGGSSLVAGEGGKDCASRFCGSMGGSRVGWYGW